MKNLIYFGSAQFTADIFESLIESKIANIVAIVTTPDRPVGRKQVITPSPLAIAAEKYNLPVYKPEKLDDANLSHLKLLKPDIFLVVAYGQYFNQNWLTTPSISTLNIHFSLLPKYRGALCISQALLNGDTETGVTLMEMGEKLDAGDIISQETVSIDLQDDNASLNSKLSEKAKTLLIEKLPLYLNGQITATPQDESQIINTPSYKTRTKQNAFIDYDVLQKAQNGHNALNTHNLVRSLNPDPGAWTAIDQKEVKILKTTIKNNQLVIEQVQVAGKNPISWTTFSQNN